MKHELYATLCQELKSLQDIERVSRQYRGQVSYDTVVSIYSNLSEGRLRACDRAMKDSAAKWLEQYNSGIDMLTIADREGFAPCNLARLLLSMLLSNSAKREDKAYISQFIRKPSLLPGRRLAANVHACVVADRQCSPRVDLIKRTVGLEYELTSAGLAFSTEDDLRDEGQAVTPDVKLTVPISIDGHTVNWIDSKAMFGDEDTHVKYTAAQFQRYIDRFGDGLVIYWFDYVDTLNTAGSTVSHPGIYVSKDFPSTFLLPVALDSQSDTNTD